MHLNLEENLLPITVLILTKNEENAIEDCIRSVRDFIQIVVVDSGSTDRTVQIAKSLGAQVVDFRWDGKYPKKKQWALNLQELKHDWILFVDADERVTTSLVEELRMFLRNSRSSSFGAIEIPLSYSFAGKQLRWGLRMYKRAFLNRRNCQFPVIDDLQVNNMWEVEGHYQPIVKGGKVGTFKGRLLHEDPDLLFHYFSRHNRYSDWEAYLRNNRGVNLEVQKARTTQGRLFNRLPCKPLMVFIFSFFLKLGFLDGKSGFHFAVCRGFYYWQIGLKADEFKRVQAACE